MALIEATSLTKRFGDNLAVDQVSLSVDRGEVVGFLGPNGAGKSTTMRMIAGFLEPDTGSASICGHDIGSEPRLAKQHLGYLPEGAPAYAEMTVGEFLTFVGRMRGLGPSDLRNRLAEMIESVNLQGTWNKQIETLSKGFKRRVGIAQALIHDPDVLILDEPTDGLDPNQKHEMRLLIRGIAANKAIVVSTHILEEVEAICSRAVIIANGKVVADETPNDLVARGTGKRAIRVTIADSEPASAIDKIKPHVNGANISVLEGLNGSTRLLIEAGDDAKPDEIAGMVGASGLVVEDVAVHRRRLDDVFREITGNQPSN